MNKVLYYLKNISYLLVVILFMISFPHISMVIEGQSSYTWICTFVFLVIAIELIVLWKSNSEVNQNNWYNGLFLITNLVFIGIFLRTCFDTSIVTVYLHDNMGLTDEPYLFLHYNLGWISFLYTMLILYPFTYLKLENNSKRKKNEK